MANSYYGFDKVTGYTPNIDFKSVRQEIEKELDSISQEREEKKKVIEENTAKLMTEANSDKGMGELDMLNESLHGLSGQVKENSLFMYQMLRTGKIKPEDYNKYVQNSTSSLNHIRTMSESMQERALQLQGDDVSVHEHHLSGDVLNLGYFNENSFFQNATTGEIFLAGIDGDGNIKYDDKGNIVNKRSASYMQNRRRSIIKEEDFLNFVSERTKTYAQMVNGEPGAMTTHVDAAFRDIQNKVNSLDDMQIADFLSQELSNYQFDFTFDKEEARQSAKEYSDMQIRLGEVGSKLEDESISEEEKTKLIREQMSLKNKMSAHKFLMYSKETENGSVIDIEIDPVLRQLAGQRMQTIFMSQMGTSVNAEQVERFDAQAALWRQTEERRTQVYETLKRGYQNIMSGDPELMKAGIAQVESAYESADKTTHAVLSGDGQSFSLVSADNTAILGAANISNPNVVNEGFISLVGGLGSEYTTFLDMSATFDSSGLYADDGGFNLGWYDYYTQNKNDFGDQTRLDAAASYMPTTSQDDMITGEDAN